jgi:hypothetical protein
MELPQIVLHLGKLFVAVGDSALSNKMASCTTGQEVYVTKTFYSSGGSLAAVVTKHCR